MVATHETLLNVLYIEAVITDRVHTSHVIGKGT